MPSGLRSVSLVVPAPVAALIEDALAGHCQAVSLRLEEAGLITVTGFIDETVDTAQLDVDLAVAAAAAGIAPPEVRIEPVAARDWLAENRETFAPFRLGRFFIHQHDDATPAPVATWPIGVDAGLAFGSGRHASTAGCLAALERVWPWLPEGSVLDLGCGSAILAIAAARVLHRPIVAADIDPVAVRIAAENAQRNGVAPLVRCVTADGCAHPLIRANAPYALVFANILARPLLRLARSVVDQTAAEGAIILAGFVESDANRVIAGYRSLGCRLAAMIVIDGWATLLLHRRPPIVGLHMGAVR